MDISISESDLRRISKAADWKLTWQADYFSGGKRYDADIFYDLLEPQHYGFILDQRYIAEDVLAGMQACLPLSVEILEERFTLRTLKPYGTEKTAYRTVVLRNGTSHRTVTYREEEPDYLMHEIMQFAGRGQKMFVNVADPDEGAYWFILLPSSTAAPQLQPIAFTRPAGKSSAWLLANATHPTPTRYLYTPLFTSNLVELPNRTTGSHVDILVFGRSAATAVPNYTLSVQTGQTLHEAVREKLTGDFDYKGAFKVLDYRIADSSSQPPRLLVHIETARFNTGKPQPRATATASWQTVPTIDIYRKHQLGFGLHTRAIE